MKIDKRTKDGQALLKRIQTSTYLAKSRVQDKIRKAAELVVDEQARQRLAVYTCKNCWYASTMAGQAITNYSCQICGTRKRHFNTTVPQICNECAADNMLCVDCMSELQYETIADARMYSVAP